jgi:hypothetical protein
MTANSVKEAFDSVCAETVDKAPSFRQAFIKRR